MATGVTSLKAGNDMKGFEEWHAVESKPYSGCMKALAAGCVKICLDRQGVIAYSNEKVEVQYDFSSYMYRINRSSLVPPHLEMYRCMQWI